jgi:hypothetical protein
MDDLKKTDSGFEDVVFSKDSVVEFIERFTPFKDSWVNFRGDEKFGLSTDYSNEITPHAIYGLDVNRLLLMAESQLKARSPNKTNFHHIGFNRRPVATIFKVEGIVVTGDPYKDYPSHWQKLLDHVTAKHPIAEKSVQRFYPRDHYIDHIAFTAILYATEFACDEILNLEGDGPYKPHPSKPSLWREMLLASGIDAIEDRSHTLTGDCDHQIAVLNPGATTLVSVLDNPLAPTNAAKFKLR